MAFQTLDLPPALMDRVATAARIAGMDVDAYVAKALTFAVDWNCGTVVTMIGGGAGSVRAGGAGGSGGGAPRTSVAYATPVLTNIPKE